MRRPSKPQQGERAGDLNFHRGIQGAEVHLLVQRARLPAALGNNCVAIPFRPSDSGSRRGLGILIRSTQYAKIGQGAPCALSGGQI